MHRAALDPLGAGRQLSIPDLRALMAAAEQFGWDDALVETAREAWRFSEPNPTRTLIRRTSGVHYSRRTNPDHR